MLVREIARALQPDSGVPQGRKWKDIAKGLSVTGGNEHMNTGTRRAPQAFLQREAETPGKLCRRPTVIAVADEAMASQISSCQEIDTTSRGNKQWKRNS